MLSASQAGPAAAGPARTSPRIYLRSGARTAAAAQMVPAPTKPVLVSFDVDGTLIRSRGERANKLHKDAFAHAFQEVFGLNTHIDVIQHHGSTDGLIAIMVLEHHKIPKSEAMAKLPQVEASMIRFFEEHAAARAGEGLETLAGVEQLLKALKAHGGAATCLVTGNLEPIGWAKMKALGLLPLFTMPLFGGFGTDFCSGDTVETWKDRGELVRFAAHKGRAALKLEGEGAKPLGDLAALVGSNEGLDAGWAARVHVGDTPMDVKAALAAGAKALGVATGIFTREQLEAVAPGNPDLVVVDSFEDLEATLKAIGLGSA